MDEITEKGKPIAITSYILIVGALIALTINAEKKNPYAAFHIRQALGLSLMFLGLGSIVSRFNDINITFAMWIFMAVLWSYGIIMAAKGEMRPIPIIGHLFQKVFRTI
ncbi:hypothetical protein CHU92_02920 [Flavobacterium cyanobacteriorum]|uniref:Import component protein n=1 Tax=Flavobacterium cyanobacteriorum TaxID=2022802 RepID=A0A255ZQU0_9FLAO|nr:hypothetical protein [Flavobacterium cyanobacteriorum]OYQ43816.1 hypothetical protein CHU92_02920 [Flavobacterium cyanobacteriorum]